MTHINTLLQLGFKENDAMVYLAALELGECQIGQLVKKTGLHKQVIYNAALSLQKSEFLNIAESEKQRIFIPLSPDLLVTKEHTNLKKAQSLAKELKNISGSIKPASDVRIFKDLNGIRQYYLEMIDKLPAKSTLRIIAIESERYFEIFPQTSNSFLSYENARIGKRIKIELIIFNEAEKETKLNQGRKFMEIRILKDNVWSPNDVVISNNKVGLLFFGEDPYLLDLPGKDVMEGFQEYFKFFWNRGETCYSG